MKFVWLAAVLLAAVLISGCAQTISAQQAYNVEIVNFAFVPAEITINAGDTVNWTNKDTAVHDVTSSLFDHDINPGESFSFAFNQTGIYDYHCDIHRSMKGRIIVR
jgi:plastocyanin